MKQLLLLSSLFLFGGLVASAQPTHPNSPHDTVRTANMTITYGRPYKKGREIFGKLEPYGKVYRVGADEATTITFAKDATFGGKPVKAGTYALFAIPNEKQWTIILNSNPKQWGAYDYDKNKAKDVLQVNAMVIPSSTVVEQLTITPTPMSVTIEWDKTKVVIPVK
jgi:hypothetical protein